MLQEGHYLLLITKRAYQGNLCGHKVYSIADTALVPLVRPSAQVRHPQLRFRTSASSSQGRKAYLD